MTLLNIFSRSEWEVECIFFLPEKKISVNVLYYIWNWYLHTRINLFVF